jgi:putative endonuclease
MPLERVLTRRRLLPFAFGSGRNDIEVYVSREYYIYILTNTYNTVLYTGMTNNLLRRVFEHKAGKGGFTSKYNVNKLVYYEITHNVQAAIAREKQIKAGSRQKKIDLVERVNPDWEDLYSEL